MLRKSIILSFLFCFCSSSANTQSRYIQEGIGVSGVTVGKSVLSDVVLKYGEDYKLIEHEKYFYEAKYLNGLSFYYCYDDSVKRIFAIKVEPPYFGITRRGIAVGESTVNDVFSQYGKSDNFTSTINETWFFEYPGVQFHIKFDSWEDDDNSRKFRKRKIIRIDIEEANRKGNACGN